MRFPNYIKEYQSIDGPIDFNDMLYRHVKEIVCNHTTYFLWANINNNLIVKDNLIVGEGVIDDSPSSESIIGVMLIEKYPGPRL